MCLAEKFATTLKTIESDAELKFALHHYYTETKLIMGVYDCDEHRRIYAFSDGSFIESTLEGTDMSIMIVSPDSARNYTYQLIKDTPTAVIVDIFNDQIEFFKDEGVDITDDIQKIMFELKSVVDGAKKCI